MKLRHPWLLKLLGFVGACVIRCWIGTVRLRYRPIGPSVTPERPGLNKRYIYAFWHENMLLLVHRYGRPDVQVLISQHADGQLIAEICRHLGFGTVRGSTTRGGVEAVRQMVRAAGAASHLAITPDGPRGPRRQVQPGLVYLAARTGLPIVPVGIGYRQAWRMRSWDRFALPRPGTLATCVTTEPIVVPPNLGKAQLEDYRLRVEKALLWASAAAESWAEQGGTCPPSPGVATPWA